MAPENEPGRGGAQSPVIEEQAQSTDNRASEPEAQADDHSSESDNSVDPDYENWLPDDSSTDATEDPDYFTPGKQDQLVPWTAPLATPAKSITYHQIKIEKSDYPFLTAFLGKRRSIDFPFPKQHQLIRYLLETLQNSCYYFIEEFFPNELTSSLILSADQIDIFDWAALIEGMRLQAESEGTNLFTNGLWPRPEISDQQTFTVGDVRQAAVHRLKYDTHSIIHTVFFLAQLDDEKRLKEVEMVLQVLYYDICRSYNVEVGIGPPTNDLRFRVRELLDVDSKAKCKTHQGMLSRIQTVLERSLYLNIQNRNPGAFRNLDFPPHTEQVELQTWTHKHPQLVMSCLDPENDQSEFVKACADIRALRLRSFTADPPDPEQFFQGMSEAMIKILDCFEDDEAIAEVVLLIEETRPHIEVRERMWRANLPEDTQGLYDLYLQTHKIRLDYSTAVAADYTRVWNYRENVVNIFTRAAQIFYDLYLEVAAGESGSSSNGNGGSGNGDESGSGGSGDNVSVSNRSGNGGNDGSVSSVGNGGVNGNGRIGSDGSGSNGNGSNRNGSGGNVSSGNGSAGSSSNGNSSKRRKLSSESNKTLHQKSSDGNVLLQPGGTSAGNPVKEATKKHEVAANTQYSANEQRRSPRVPVAESSGSVAAAQPAVNPLPPSRPPPRYEMRTRKAVKYK